MLKKHYTKKKKFNQYKCKKSKTNNLLLSKFHLQCIPSVRCDNNASRYYWSAIRFLPIAKTKKRFVPKWSNHLRLWSIYKRPVVSRRYYIDYRERGDCLRISFYRRGCTKFELGNRRWYVIGKIVFFFPF